MGELALRALQLLDEGRSVREIAVNLGVSEPETQALLDEAVQKRDSAATFWDTVHRTANRLWSERKAGRFDSTTFMRPVLSRVGRTLRSEGFRRRGSTFRREPEQGLLQTVAVETGLAYPTRPSLTYGHFAVDLLVDLDDVLLLDSFPQDNQPRREIAPRHATVARMRLGADWHDMWWPMVGDPQTASDEVVEKLVHEGLPFLARFASRAGIEDELVTSRPATFARAVPELLAALHLRRQEYLDAQRILTEYLEQSEVPAAHRRWLERFVLRLAEL